MNDASNAIKIFFKFILKYYLKYLTKITLFIHQPLIICVTGGSNVLFTKQEIKRRLIGAGFDVRSNPKNFNTEIGLPLAILNLPAGYNSYKNWLPVIWRACKSLFNPYFPKILILSLGVSSPGDMRYLLSIVKPKIGVITNITQKYLESFNDMDELADEYDIFIKSINKNGFIILNHDNERIKKLSKNSVNNAIYFGLKEGEEGSKNYWRCCRIDKNPGGQTLLIKNDAGEKRYGINRFGEHHVYSLICALIAVDLITTKKLS